MNLRPKHFVLLVTLILFGLTHVFGQKNNLRLEAVEESTSEPIPGCVLHINGKDFIANDDLTLDPFSNLPEFPGQCEECCRGGYLQDTAHFYFRCWQIAF